VEGIRGKMFSYALFIYLFFRLVYRATVFLQERTTISTSICIPTSKKKCFIGPVKNTIDLINRYALLCIDGVLSKCHFSMGEFFFLLLTDDKRNHVYCPYIWILQQFDGNCLSIYELSQNIYRRERRKRFYARKQF